MKKLSCLAALLLLVTTFGFAQGFYLRLGMGYAFPQAGQTTDGTGEPYNGSTTNNTATQVMSVKPSSFSAGLQGGMALGYMFGEHVGVQMDLGLGLSHRKYTFNDYNVTISGIQSNVSVVEQAKTPIMVTPSLVVQSGGDVWNLYTRFGVVLPLSTKITQDQILSNAPGTGAIEIDDFTFQIKNSFGLGFAAAAGVQYKINDKVSIWGEASLLSLSVNIKESDITSITSNGQGVSLSQYGGPLTTTYSKNATVDSTGAQQSTYSQPFSNISINVGVAFRFGNNERSQSRRGRNGKDEDLIDRPKNSRFK